MISGVFKGIGKILYYHNKEERNDANIKAISRNIHIMLKLVLNLVILGALWNHSYMSLDCSTVEDEHEYSEAYAEDDGDEQAYKFKFAFKNLKSCTDDYM